MSSPRRHAQDWLYAFAPLGRSVAGSWTPVGGGVLLLDAPTVWLVTVRTLLDGLGDDHLSAWLPTDGDGDGAMLDVTDSQRISDLDWVHHPIGLSATLFPLDARLQLKAFAETQCTRVRDLHPLAPAATVGCLYGPDVAPSQQPIRAVHDGIIAAVDATSGTIFATATMLPRNAGCPLLLASPYGGQVTIAGIVTGETMLTDHDPRTLPVRLTQAVCIDAALELIRGPAASAQRRRVTERTEPAPPSDA